VRERDKEMVLYRLLRRRRGKKTIYISK
jgi:hypothetical protein